MALSCAFDRYFRTFLEEVDGKVRGYNKPVMLAGGLGNIRGCHIQKGPMSGRW